MFIFVLTFFWFCNICLYSSSRDRDGKTTKDDKGKILAKCMPSALNAICMFLFDILYIFLNYILWKPVILGTDSTNNSSRNIWVSGLSSNTKAADLKNLFGKYGKVNAYFYANSHFLRQFQSPV